MAKYNVTFIPGDGIGPEVSQAARRCIDSTGVSIEWEEKHAGMEVMEKCGTPLPGDVLDSIKKNKIALKGPITTPIGSGIRSVNVELRKLLDLYACLRPCKSLEGTNTRYKNIDLVVVRENTEDLYAGIEFHQYSDDYSIISELVNKLTKRPLLKDGALSLKPISEAASKRIVEFAFKYALKYKRKKVTCVHKANIMKYSDGLFLRSSQEVAKKYEGRVLFEDRLVDNLAMQLVQKPNEYDVLVLPNLYGDIISDLCAGLIGGLGMAPGANIGESCAVFEATHGSAPKYKGLNKVNPTAMILSGVLLLRHLGEEKAADKLEAAVRAVVKEGKYVTYDLKPSRDDPSAVGTSQMAEAIIDKLKCMK
ncbi:MAG: isocitrate/isopropylmalate dehydrogenase family protein [Candidatus Omnitrophota bacterium]